MGDQLSANLDVPRSGLLPTPDRRCEVVTISIGTARFDATTTTGVNGLLRNADIAMYVNKRSGRSL